MKNTLRCRDNCGAAVIEGEGVENIVEMVALRQGWTLLPVAGGWRCGECWRKLNRAAQLEGAAATALFVDKLPASSIGALKKPTADTIVPPVVPE